jgi:zinc protease
MSFSRICRLACIVALNLVASMSASAGIVERAVRTNVGGIDVIAYPMDVEDVVTIEGSLHAGNFQASQGQSNIAAAALAGMLLDRATAGPDKLTIAQQLDDIGARLTFSVNAQVLRINGKCLRKDLPVLIRLLAEALRSPAYTPQEFELAKRRLEGTLRAASQDTNLRAKEAYSTAVFPAAHPNHGGGVEQWLRGLETVTLRDVQTFRHRYYGPTGLTLIFAGDIDAAMIRSEVAQAFSGWTGGVPAERSAPRGSEGSRAAREIVILDKASVTVLLGLGTGLRQRDAESLALGVGTAILGSGMTGRLMNALRDREGLTYFISAALADDAFVDGSWLVNGSFAPELVKQGVDSTYREVRRWWQDGVTQAELDARKANLIGSHEVTLATTQGAADALLQCVHSGRPLSWLDDYPRAVQALTVRQVNAAIRKHVDPHKLMLVKAGTLGAQSR